MCFFHLNRKWILASLPLVAIVLVACGDSATATPLPTATPVPTAAPTETPVPEPTTATVSAGSAELTAEEADYIEQVRAGWNEFNAKAMEFRSVFAQTYSQKSRLFQALLDAGAGTAIEGALAAIEQIDAPDRFKTDQELMVQTLTEQVSYDRDVRSAAGARDLAGFAIARLSEPEDFPFSFCSSNEQIPGGQYGAELNAAVARFTAGVFARFINFGLHYEPSDIIATEVVLIPERADLVSGLLVDLENIQPTSGLADDHNKLVEYFEGLSEITIAQGTALDAQDLGAYRVVGTEGRALYCDASADLSPDMTQIAGLYFASPLGVCAPAPNR